MAGYCVQGYSPDIWLLADRKAKSQRNFLNSCKGLVGRQTGCLGEKVFERWMTLNGIQFIDNTGSVGGSDYIILPSRRTVEVKSKNRRVVPQGGHNASVPKYVYDHQVPNYYCFASTVESAIRVEQVYLVGCITRSGFDQRKRLTRKGESDGPNGAKAMYDTYNVYVHELNSMTWLLTELRLANYFLLLT